MSEYLEGFKGFYESLTIYMEKYASRPAKDKNHAFMLQLAGDYYEDCQKILAEQGENEFLSKISQVFLDFQGFVEEHDLSKLNSLSAEVNSIIKMQEDKEAWIAAGQKVFQNGIAQMKLQEEMLKSCQALVNLDIKLSGELSSMTKEILEVHHVEVVEGQVREIQKELESGKSAPAFGISESPLNDMDNFLKQHETKLQTLKELSGKNTLVVNAYAGPGAGKTTACLSTVAELKKRGYVVEYVSEYAKELVYDNPALLDGSKENQQYILEEQLKRLDRFMGKVDIIVTDASILLNPVYLAVPDQDYTKTIGQLYKQYENFNFFVQRGEDYVQEGRMENREESLEKDQQIKDILGENNLFYGSFNHKTVDKLAEKIEITYKRINEKPPVLAAYQALAYPKQKADKPKVIYGETPEELISTLQEMNAAIEERKFYSCYIRKLNPETKGYESLGRYAVDTGEKIASKFAQKGREKESVNKISVRGKLEANKGKIEAENAEIQSPGKEVKAKEPMR